MSNSTKFLLSVFTAHGTGEVNMVPWQCVSCCGVTFCSQPRLPDGVPSASVPALDVQWIETTQKKAALKLEKLDMDLKNYKSNSIKESIR